MALGCGRADQGNESTMRMAAEASSGQLEPHDDLIDLRHRELSPERPDEPGPDQGRYINLGKPALEKTLGNFELTYYWVATQKKKGNEPIFDKRCKRIARVSKSFKRRLNLEGSGLLEDGRTVSTAGGCQCGSPCYWIPNDSHKWGAGVAQRPLSPFRSIAVDPSEVKIGTSLYIAELDGLTMPGSGSEGGFVHDGCVVADDRGGGVKGKQIDFFAGWRAHYRNFFSRHKLTQVTVFPGGERCHDHANQHASLRTANAGSS